MHHADIKPPAEQHYAAFIPPELCEYDPAEEKDSGWLISFVDILSLLITLFVLLLSFSHASRPQTPHRVTVAKALSAPPTAQHAAKPAPSLVIPQNIKNMIDVVSTAHEVNLVIKDDVLFAEGSVDLTPLGRSVLDGIAQMLNHNDYPVSVEGHTDNIPIHSARFPSNWELSSFRATNVARYFIERGVPSERLRAIGYADTHPIATNDTAAGRARNRRVSLVIHMDKAAQSSGHAVAPAPPAAH
jgi:chemotaxis protein MotB